MKMGEKMSFFYIPGIGFINTEETIENTMKRIEEKLIEKGYEECEIAEIICGLWYITPYED